jgi:hypothetical protein
MLIRFQTAAFASRTTRLQLLQLPTKGEKDDLVRPFSGRGLSLGESRLRGRDELSLHRKP